MGMKFEFFFKMTQNKINSNKNNKDQILKIKNHRGVTLKNICNLIDYQTKI